MPTFGKPRPDPIAPGQRSVWDFPRPPSLETVRDVVRIRVLGQDLVVTDAALAVCEESHPPAYFVPPGDVADGWLRKAGGATTCEWKGSASYFDLVDPATSRLLGERSVFCYEEPVHRFAEIAGYLCFYAGPCTPDWPRSHATGDDGCFVGDERVRPQDGGFYSGWITKDLVGPFKGVPGSHGW